MGPNLVVASRPRLARDMSFGGEFDNSVGEPESANKLLHSSSPKVQHHDDKNERQEEEATLCDLRQRRSHRQRSSSAPLRVSLRQAARESQARCLCTSTKPVPAGLIFVRLALYISLLSLLNPSATTICSAATMLSGLKPPHNLSEPDAVFANVSTVIDETPLTATTTLPTLIGTAEYSQVATAQVQPKPAPSQHQFAFTTLPSSVLANDDEDDGQIENGANQDIAGLQFVRANSLDAVFAKQELSNSAGASQEHINSVPMRRYQAQASQINYARAKISTQKVTPTPETTLILDDECMRDRRWWVFLLSSFLTLIVGIFIILIYRAISFLIIAYGGCSSQVPVAQAGFNTGQANQMMNNKSMNSNSSTLNYQQQQAALLMPGIPAKYQPQQSAQPTDLSQQLIDAQLYPHHQSALKSSIMVNADQSGIISSAVGGGKMYHSQPGAAALGQPMSAAALAEQAHNQRYHQVDQQTQVGWMTEAKDWAGELISGQSATGRILVILVFMLSIASLVIYFIDASRIGPNNGQYSEGVEKCQKWSESATQQIDLALNIFFMVYFFIRVSSHIEAPLLTSCQASSRRLRDSFIVMVAIIHVRLRCRI